MPEMTTAAPSHVLSARELFGIDTDLTVRAFREPSTTSPTSTPRTGSTTR